MITREELGSIIEQYRRHDWVLRRALLTTSTAEQHAEFFASADPLPEVAISENDALWFSRRSLPDREAWELRRLSGSPFALVTVLEDSMDEHEREDLLNATEAQMFDGSHREPTSH